MEKVALITGATDGIGKATAKKLLTEGWEVVIIGRSASRCETSVKELKLATGSEKIRAITKDLSSLEETSNACSEFLENYNRLDFLCLNANAISNERIVTKEGFEKNLALGFLSRVVMTRKLEEVMQRTPGANILSVLGLNRIRPDFDDLTMERGFSGWKGLGRWQWAVDLWSREYNKLNLVPVNLYMPGLVKTKILSNEPQPMRALVQIMNVIMGISTTKSAENIYIVMKDILDNNRQGELYSYKKLKRPAKLQIELGDPEKLWKIAEGVVVQVSSLKCQVPRLKSQIFET